MIKNNGLKKFEAKDGANVYFMAVLSLLLLQILFSIIFSSAQLEEGTGGYNILSYLASAFFQIGYLCVFIAYLGKKQVRPQIFIQPRIKPVFYFAAVVAPFACLLFFYPASYAFDVFLDFLKFPSMPDIQTGGAVEITLIVLATVIMAPVCEELIYRSALVSGLKKKYSSNFKGMLLCVVLGGAAFSFMHMSPRQTIFQFFLGGAAVILVLTSNSVIPSIILHFLNNLIVVLTYFIEPLNVPFLFVQDTLLSTMAGLVISAILFTAAGIAAFLGLWVFLKKYSENAQDMQSPQGEQDTQAEQELAKAEIDNAKENKNFYTALIFGFGICLFMWVSQLAAGIFG